MLCLVVFDCNQLDEFDIHGVKLFTEDEWKEYQRAFGNAIAKRKGISWYFGTNEAIYIEDESFFESFRVIKLKAQEEQVLLDKILVCGEFGNFPDIDVWTVYDEDD